MTDNEKPDRVIELTVDPGSIVDQSEKTGSSRPWYRWLRQRRLVVVAVAVIGASALVSYRFLTPQSPEDIARDFMESVHAGDVEDALELVDLDPPNAREDLLVPEVVSDSWDIDSVETISEEKELEVAIVRVTISNDDGENETGDLQFRLNEDNQWDLTNGLTYLDVSAGAMTYLEVNGHQVSLEQSERGIFALLPGAYEFYEAGLEVIDVAPMSALAVAGQYKDLMQRVSLDDPVLRPRLSVQGATVQEVQARFDDLVDECVDISASNVEGCPFGFASHDGVAQEPGSEWEVVQYPTISLATVEDHSGRIAIGVQAGGEGTVRGEVKIGDVVTERECDINPDGMEVAVLKNGELVITPFDLPDRERHGMNDLAGSSCSEILAWIAGEPARSP